MAVGCHDLGAGGANGMDGLGTRMHRKNECHTSPCQIGGIGHAQGKIPIGANTSCGVDSVTIGKDLALEELQRGRHGFVSDGGEVRVQKRKQCCCCCWHRHVLVATVATKEKGEAPTKRYILVTREVSLVLC
jgi:hypothetical protein